MCSVSRRRKIVSEGGFLETAQTSVFVEKEQHPYGLMRYPRQIIDF